MNTNDVFSRLHYFDLDVPPDLDLNDIGPMLSKLGSTPSTTSPTSTKELNFPWNIAGLSGLNNMGLSNLNSLSTSDHFALLHSTATQLYANNAGTLQSLGASIQPHLRGPMTPVLIIAVSIMVSLLVSFVVSIIQMAVLAGAVVYFFPSVVAAVSAGAAGGAPAHAGPGAGAAPGKPISRTPVAAFAGVLAASYAFSSIATMVVIASSAYAYLNHAAVAAKNNTADGSYNLNNSNSYIRPDARSTRREERSQSHSSMFRRISRHRDSY